MILIWKGWGVAIVGFLILSAIVFFTGTHAIFSPQDAKAAEGWLPGPICLLAAAMTFFLGRHFDQQPGRAFIDKATGREFVLRPTHSLFFIKVSHWAPILAIVGVLLLVLKAVQG